MRSGILICTFKLKISNSAFQLNPPFEGGGKYFIYRLFESILEVLCSL